MNDRVRELECVISDLKQQARDAEKDRDDLLEALQNIAEYWNQDQNEAAMADACWHAIHTARTAIAKATGEQP